jgi:hypothetical protein
MTRSQQIDEPRPSKTLMRALCCAACNICVNTQCDQQLTSNQNQVILADSGGETGQRQHQHREHEHDVERDNVTLTLKLYEVEV